MQLELNKKLLERLSPYIPGFQPEDKDAIKLNTNENPYILENEFLKNLKFSSADLRKYPNSDGPLKEVAKFYLKDESLSENVFIGNGSDEVLAFALNTLFNPSKKIRIADITYSLYLSYAKLFNLKMDIVPLKKMKYDLEGYFNSKGGVILVNPNAPTGELLSIDNIKKILDNNMNVPVLIDEAYIDFSKDFSDEDKPLLKNSALNLIGKYKNLLVVRTLSKGFSLAGLRVGFAFGNKNLISAIKKVKNSFNSYPISAFSIAVTKSVLSTDKENSSIKKIIKTREWLIKKMREKDFEVLPSFANFILVKPKNIKAVELYKKLKEDKIFVRYFDSKKLKDYLRITVGRDADMRKLIERMDI